jgi:hypothetical protein
MRAMFGKSLSNRWLTWAAIPTVAGVGALALSSFGSSPPDKHAPLPTKPVRSMRRHFPLVTSPDTVELGVVRSGEPAEASLRF